MMGVRFPIDAVWLDANRRVLALSLTVQPLLGMAFCRGADSVLELPVGAVATSHTEVGDRLDFLPAPATDNLTA